MQNVKFKINKNSKNMYLSIDNDSLFSVSQITYDKIINQEIPSFFETIYPLINFIDHLIFKQQKAIIGIDGMSNSFKTTICKYLNELFQINLFHMDNYFKIPPSNNLKYGNNIKYDVIINEIINYINNTTKPFKYPIYTNHKQTPEYKKSNNYNITIIEGAYSLNSPLEPFINYKVLIKTTSEKQLERLIKREIPGKVDDFLNKWIPLENNYLKYLETNTSFNLILTT